MSTKYYAVRKGRVPGIYASWDECKEQTEGFSGADFKSFKSYEQAAEWIGQVKDIFAIPKETLMEGENAFSNAFPDEPSETTDDTPPWD